MGTILLTGCNRGIGLELVRQYVADSWRVYACCRQPATAYELNDLAAQSAGKLSVHPLDVVHEEQRRALAHHLRGVAIDILFNNAGTYGDWAHQDFGSSNEVVWERTFRTNVIATMQMMEAFLPNVAASEQKIIANMSSKMGSMADNGSGGSYIYRSSKAALNAVSVSAARDLEDKGVKVVVLHPGWVRTDMGGPNGELSVTESAQALRQNLAGLTAEDSGRFIDIDGSTIPW